jgi:hypothetical protein
MRALVMMVVAIAAVPLFAQVDLAVEVTPDGTHSARLSAAYSIEPGWNAAEAPEDVVVTIQSQAPVENVYSDFSAAQCRIEGQQVRCTLTSRSGPHSTVIYIITKPPAPGTYTATATITATTPDPNPQNNTSAGTVEVSGLPSFAFYAQSAMVWAERATDPGRPDRLTAGVQNVGEPATDVTVRVTLPEGGSFTGVDDTEHCSATPAEVVCRYPVLDPFGTFTFTEIDYRAPERNDGGTFPVRLDVTASGARGAVHETSTTDVPLRRRILVTHAGDAGAGSLRQAIADANAACASTQCLIAFTTTEVIRPVTPLPLVRGFVKIDGGDAKAELDGSLLGEGHAIASMHPCEMRVVNLRIHHFPGHAIDLGWDDIPCESGTLLTRAHVLNNELWQNLRGVVAKVVAPTIASNVIRDHRRAGVFLEGNHRALVDRNTITGNGASGVFVNLSPSELYSSLTPDAKVTNNVIRNNAEWGVCRTPNGWVEVTGNEIADNHAHAIDIGLDLDTPNRPDATKGFPNKPILLSAHYDAANGSTVLHGRLDPFSGSRIDVYASRGVSGAGHPQAERLIAIERSGAPGAFELRIPGDYRGLWLTATSTQTHAHDWELTASDTSEISNAVPVQ